MLCIHSILQCHLSQVYINRTSEINSSEVFGFTKQLSEPPLQSIFGEMYVETKGSNIYYNSFIG